MTEEQEPSQLLKILVLIDWDNLWINLLDAAGSEGISLPAALDKLKAKLEEVGIIVATIVFAPPHLTPYYREVCYERNFYLFTCLKRIEIEERRRLTEIEEIKAEEIDTVDHTLIEFGKLMLSNENIDAIALVSGDGGFGELFESAHQKNKKSIICAPSINCLSRFLVPLADRDSSGKKMIFRLDEK